MAVARRWDADGRLHGRTVSTHQGGLGDAKVSQITHNVLRKLGLGLEPEPRPLLPTDERFTRVASDTIGPDVSSRVHETTPVKRSTNDAAATATRILVTRERPRGIISTLRCPMRESRENLD